eukprot:8385553-Heterocapsa_arctica.AAC.1
MVLLSKLELVIILDGESGRLMKSFNEHGPLKGNIPSSDRAEVRALVAALEKAENNIEVITDN